MSGFVELNTRIAKLDMDCIQPFRGQDPTFGRWFKLHPQSSDQLPAFLEFASTYLQGTPEVANVYYNWTTDVLLLYARRGSTLLNTQLPNAFHSPYVAPY